MDTAHSEHNRWIILAIVSTALFFVVIDMTVLYTALPTLTHDLRATASEKLWILNAYTLIMAGLLPCSGSLGDYWGHKKLLLAGLVVFGIASICAAYSPSAEYLIASRVLLAVGASMMMPATLSIIRLTFTDDKERGLAIGIWAAIASGGAAFGPLLGGILLNYFWWGSVFLINVPFVLLAFICAQKFLPTSARSHVLEWDLKSAMLIMVGMISTTFAIKEMAAITPSYTVIALTGTFGLGILYAFYRTQKNHTNPTIDFSLFRNKLFSSGVAAALVSAFCLIGLQLVLNQRLQLVLGFTPLQSGIFTLPISILSFIAGPCTGLLIHRIGTERIMPIALMIMAVGIGALFVFKDAHLYSQILGLSILGIGIGASTTIASNTIMNYAPPEQSGMAASIEEVSYEMGGAMGIALLGSLMTAIYAASLHIPTDADIPLIVFDSLDQALLIAESMTTDAAQELTTLARNAFDRAFDIVMLTTACVTFITAAGISLTLFARKKTRLSQAHQDVL